MSFARIAIGLTLLAAMLPAAPASAAPVVSISRSVPGTGDAIAIDSAGHRIFVGGGPGTDGVSVFSFHGDFLGVIAGEKGVTGLMVDGSTLYVVQSDGAAVDLIDLHTLAVTRHISTWATLFGNPVLASNKLWLCDREGQSLPVMASIGLDRDSVTNVYGYSFREFPYGCPVLAASAAHPDVLIAASTAQSPGEIYRYDTSGSAPQIVAYRRTDTSSVSDARFSADGTRLYVPGAGVLDPLTLATATALPSSRGLIRESTTGSVAMTAPGSINLYRSSDYSPVGSRTVSGDYVVAFDFAEGAALFVVLTTSGASDTRTLTVLDGPSGAISTSVSAAASCPPADEAGHTCTAWATTYQPVRATIDLASGQGNTGPAEGAALYDAAVLNRAPAARVRVSVALWLDVARIDALGFYGAQPGSRIDATLRVTGPGLNAGASAAHIADTIHYDAGRQLLTLDSLVQGTSGSVPAGPIHAQVTLSATVGGVVTALPTSANLDATLLYAAVSPAAIP